MKYDLIEYDNETKALSVNRRLRIPADQIRAAAFLPAALVVRGSREPDERNTCPVLALSLKTPVKQGLSQTDSLLLAVQDADAAREFCSAAGCDPAAGSDSSSFSFDSVIVEAKIGMNDYTRAATTGTNAYGRMGQVAPVIDAAVDCLAGSISVRYLGTTSKMMASRYFSAHPQMSFDMRGADWHRRLIRIRGSKYELESEYQYRSIERDENASGLWMARVLWTVKDPVDALEWFRALDGLWAADERRMPDSPAAADAPAPGFDPAVSDEQAAALEALDFSRNELLRMLDALHDAGVLSDLEWNVKKELVNGR